MNWEIQTKLQINNKRDLSLVYTPGVGECCLKIKENKELAMELTNKANSIAVMAFENKKELANQKALELLNKGFSAYPIILKKSAIPTQRIVKSLEPTFGTFDLSLIEENIQNINTKLPTPIESSPLADLPEDIKKASVELHKTLKGVIKQAKTDKPQKLVGVVSNGSAVLGFGNIGPDAAMPVMEGKAALFKKFGEVSAIPICIDTQNINEFIEIVKALEPTFDGINLEDICAPDCFEIEQTLIRDMNIPIFHDDQHGTAIIVLSGIINALKLTNKKPEEIKVVLSGAGAAAQAVTKLLLEYGVKNTILTDVDGAVYSGRKQNDKHLEIMAQKTNPQNLKGSLKEVITNADIFIGLSAAGVLKPEMIKTMKAKPIVFALANPNPEILPDEALKAGAYIIATGRSDFPNQVNNSLAFPGIFKGILKTDLKEIDNKIKLKAAIALANHVKDLSTENIIPDALDEQVPAIVSDAVMNV